MRSWNLSAFFISSTICTHNFSFQTLSLYFLFDMSLPHIYAVFHQFPKKNQTAVVASKNSKHSGCDAGLFTLSESSRFRPVQTHSVPSNILAWRRRQNEPETSRRRSCQCEHIHLNTHEEISLNGDVPRWNGNMTYSVNQPLLCYVLTVHGVTVLRQAEV
jgi:hypothetical protein